MRRPRASYPEQLFDALNGSCDEFERPLVHGLGRPPMMVGDEALIMVNRLSFSLQLDAYFAWSYASRTFSTTHLISTLDHTNTFRLTFPLWVLIYVALT
jgi:hypothetical protein